eukprot:TRINITY_DN3739_c0_g1_i1.p1 TRINITY_DN3739_c0_g1~~TRINITY_DN3739_c0_g1_i1.p1  ORF type:complete len:459 (-),score=125.51 TRINITY_DN3739_c0_g1_i1:84-1406(-)
MRRIAVILDHLKPSRESSSINFSFCSESELTNINDLNQAIQKIFPQLIEIRRHFHQYPEIAFQEYKTMEKILEYVGKMGKVTRANPTGFFVDIRGKGLKQPNLSKDRIIGFRADMDALPLLENNPNLPYVSKNEGAAHSCGHDNHMTCLIGLAMLIHSKIDQIPSNNVIRLIFQPAEEGERGAEKILEAGALKGVDEIYGYHYWSGFEVGKIKIKEGALMAHSTHFKITISGKGGHASTPELCIDPVACASQIVNSLHTIVSRNVSSSDRGVLTVSKVTGGTAHNVIPDDVELEGTTRDFDKKVGNIIRKRMYEVVEQTAKAFNCSSKIEWFSEYPVLVNSKKEAEHVVRIASKLFGSDSVDSVGLPIMGAEDFSLYLEEEGGIPGAFFFVGGAVDKKVTAHHTSSFNANDENMPYVVSLFMAILQDRLNLLLFDYQPKN